MRDLGAERADAARASGRTLPNFLIAGAMRSGTTSLTRYLRSHPQVFMSRPKEVHFFDIEFPRGPEWYARHFAGAMGEVAVGEATPNYLYIREAVPRMAELIPGARLVVILRNPVDRAYSHYWHNRAVGRERLTFEEAIAAEPSRIATDDPRARAHWSYVDRGRYVAQLERVCDWYPRSALHVMLFDDLRDDPGGTYRSVCRFLGVDEQHVPGELGAPVNRYTSFRSARVRRLAKALPRPVSRAIGRLNAKPSAAYPAMAPETRADLYQLFASGNERLSQWLGRDLKAWDE